MNLHAVAVIVRHVPVDDPTGSSTGAARAVVTSALLYAGVVVAGLLLAAPLATRRWRPMRLLTAAGIVASLTAVAARGEPVGEVAVTAVHLGAVALWVGAVLHLAIATVRGNGDQVRRHAAALAPYAVASAVIVAGSGTVLVLAHHLSVRELLTTTFGAVVVVKAVALLVAGLLGVGHRRTHSPRERRTFVRGEAAALGAALASGSVLLGVTPPVPPVVAIAPGLARLSFTGAAPVPVYLRAENGGGRLTLLGNETVQVDDRTGGRSFQLAPGATAEVALHGGRAHLSVTSGVWTRRVTLDAASVPVPSSALLSTVYDRDRFALGRTLGRLAIVGLVRSAVCLPDATAVTAVTSRFARQRGAQLISTDAASAQQELHALASSSVPPAGGVYLGPNLLDGAVLATAAQLRLPPLAVVGVGDPMSPLADRFRSLLQQIGAGTTPSDAALLGYESVVAPETERTVGLFVAEPVGFLPGVLDVGHNHSVGAWIPGGTIVAVSHSVTVPLVCSTEEST